MTALERLKELFALFTEKYNRKVMLDLDRFKGIEHRFKNMEARLKRLERSPWQKFKDHFND